MSSTDHFLLQAKSLTSTLRDLPIANRSKIFFEKLQLNRNKIKTFGQPVASGIGYVAPSSTPGWIELTLDQKYSTIVVGIAASF